MAAVTDVAAVAALTAVAAVDDVKAVAAMTAVG